jgi:acyl carrier protein
LDPLLVVPEATLSDLGVTSLDLVEIIMAIEDE